MLVVRGRAITVGMDDREERLRPYGLGPGEEVLAFAPRAKRFSDRARERDVERDPELDVLRARRAELACRHDRILGPGRRDDERVIVLEHDERVEDPRPLDRDLLEDVE